MFQNIGDFINHILIIAFGIIAFIAYSKKKKAYQLWLGIAFMLTGILLTSISLFNMRNNQNNLLVSITPPVITKVDSSLAVADYERVIRYLLEESDTTKTDTILTFSGFKLTVKGTTIYDHHSEEPVMLFPATEANLIVTFKNEKNIDNSSLSHYSQAVVKNLMKNNRFSPVQEIDNMSSIMENSIIQYSFIKKHKGVEVINGLLLFVKMNNNVTRISIGKIGSPSQEIDNYINNLKEQIKENVLQQGV